MPALLRKGDGGCAARARAGVSAGRLGQDSGFTMRLGTRCRNPNHRQALLGRATGYNAILLRLIKNKKKEENEESMLMKVVRCEKGD